jgi:hypothetical protein
LEPRFIPVRIAAIADALSIILLWLCPDSLLVYRKGQFWSALIKNDEGMAAYNNFENVNAFT